MGAKTPQGSVECHSAYTNTIMDRLRILGVAQSDLRDGTDGEDSGNSTKVFPVALEARAVPGYVEEDALTLVLGDD